MSSTPAPSDHFRNGRFFNPGVPVQGFGELLRWVTHRTRGYWPKFIEAQPGPRSRERIAGQELAVTFVNHSTFLLQTCGLNILTDPVWSERVSPIAFLGPRRHRDPGVLFGDLPPIDALLISHNHYDHFDLPTLRRLAARDCPAVFCPLGLRPLVARAGFREIYDLDWWQQISWRGAALHCVPAQHFSSRTPFDRDRTLWGGWVFAPADGQPIYFAGDTGFGPHFAAIASRFANLRLALLPIGAFEPQWFMGPVHMSPEQAVEAHRLLHARTSVAAHFGTFALADDGLATPVEHLRAALGDGIGDSEFLVLVEGQAQVLPLR